MFLKGLISKIPYPISEILTKVPFRLRLGKNYSFFQKLIIDSEKWSLDQKNEYVISSLNKIKTHAEKDLPFYRNLYEEHGVLGLQIKDFNDWGKLPIVNKELIRTHFKSFHGPYKVNTGGTSGEPFAFYLDKFAWAREWAHMHFIWNLKGYNYQFPKITLRGKNLEKEVFQFNPIHNEFIINTYLNFSIRENALIIKGLIEKKKIHFVHGYPSAIFNFFLELEKSLNQYEILEIKRHLKICLFGSEFPVFYMVEYLRKVWGLDYISWYGHSEMCILAYDDSKSNLYRPFLTYGFPEISKNELIGTSFHNLAMPLIRYKTGDLIEAEMEGGRVESFSIKEGREGDFIEDKFGKKISLTALIFGRHHKAFEFFEFIQVTQIEAGLAKIIVTSKSNNPTAELNTLFDFNNVNIKFQFEIVNRPILSKAGKFKLKI